MELSAYVEEKLMPKHKLNIVIEAGLVLEFIKTTRILALIECDDGNKGNSAVQAILVFQTARVPVHSAIDLSVEQAIAIDSSFKCEIDTASAEYNTDVLISISSGKSLRFQFEMIFSQQTNAFVSEVLKASEVISKRKGIPPEFTWLNEYRTPFACGETKVERNEVKASVTTEIDNKNCSESAVVDSSQTSVTSLMSSQSAFYVYDAQEEKSPEIGINRHGIALGVSPTPIAARESHIRHQMALKESLAEWLAVDKEPPDMYAVAFQELDLNKEAFLFNVTPREQDWLNSVLNGIHPKAKYKKVRLVRLVGMMLIVLVQEKHLAYVRNVCVDTVGTGIMNKMGNKGAVSIHLDLHGTSICFVNTHMATHLEEWERRNEDYDCILQRTVYNLKINGPPKSIRDHDKKLRHPAWCDRILWSGDGIKQLAYRSHPSLIISDHKPVSALFDADIKVIDARRYRRIYEEVMKKLDKLENEFLPQVTVDSTEIIFDIVRFLQPQTKYLTIANTGQVPVQFKFIKKLGDAGYCKLWLGIRPYTNFIMPGDKCDVELEVLVDKRTASQLTSGDTQLYDILVLHLEGGKDIFITVTGEYERSCFGSSVNALVHMNVPFKDVPVSKIIDLEKGNSQNFSEMPYAIPKELWYLVDHLHSHALHIEGLFTVSGLKKEIVEIRTCLDTGVPDDILPGSIHSVAEALLLFLEALAEPVVPMTFYNEALEAAPNFCQCKNVIEKLPVYHKNVFTYVMAFLNELLLHSQDNNLDAKLLAMVFGSILLRDSLPSSKRVTSQAVERKKQTFIYQFLVNEPC